MNDELDAMWANMGPAARRLNAERLGRPNPQPGGAAPAVPGGTGATDTAEKVWQGRVNAIGTRQGWLWYHTHNSQRSPSGYPDWCAVRGGRIVYAELKTDAKQSRPTAAQIVWLDTLASIGAPVEVYLWRPADIDEVEAILAATAREARTTQWRTTWCSR